MPSSVVGAVAFRKVALNCRPWVRSLTQLPEPLTNSPAEISGGMADHGDRVALAAHLDPQHAEAGLGIVEGDPLDQAGQSLAVLARLGYCPRHPHMMARQRSGGYRMS